MEIKYSFKYEVVQIINNLKKSKKYKGGPLRDIKIRKFRKQNRKSIIFKKIRYLGEGRFPREGKKDKKSRKQKKKFKILRIQGIKNSRRENQIKNKDKKEQGGTIER